ncbi:MAG: YgcG family protein [Chlorobium phaeobacteroides]|uniref:TPM domain-containing protein n=1 Tax=Chlorobium phaeobacteroides (strain BS1) TaxID=331678 RepID=B3EJE7_CHLPB|nr:YgcG family protein [Chlorobium phaeobacteroides]
MKTKPLFFSLVILFFVSSSLYGADVPYLTGRITDNAEILSPEVNRSLSESLKAHEKRTRNQIAVLTIPTLDGESIEDYAVRVFELWKLGQKGEDNGVLIVVVPNDRRMRIEVGYGLEGTLTDAMAGRIIQNVMTPKFKNGDFDAGIADGAGAVMEVLEGGALPETAVRSGSAEKSKFFEMEGPDLSITERVLLGAFIFGIIGLFTAIGIVTPGFGWFLYLFLIPFWASFPIVVLGSDGAFKLFIAYLIGFPVAKLYIRNIDWYQKAQKDLRTKGKASIGGMTIGSGSSGSSWSSGGSGFSGSGGSSGGGGASGSW